MDEMRVSFARCSDLTGAYRLVELPPDVYKRVECGEQNVRMTMKGHAEDDVVICEEDKTYALRTVVHSNTFLITSPPGHEDNSDIVVRDQVSHVLELVPIVPNVVGKLSAMLRDSDYREGHEDDSDEADAELDYFRPAKRQRLRYDEMQEHIQASEQELQRGLKDERVLLIRGHLRRLERGYLAQMLRLLLNSVVTRSMSPEAALVDELLVTMEEHDIPRDITEQILPWFGIVSGNKWAIDVARVSQEIGLSILRSYQYESILLEDLISAWADAVGEPFVQTVDLRLLEGNYIQDNAIARPTNQEDGAHSITTQARLTYLPRSSLPLDPGMRFNDLFIVKPRWKSEELVPFLRDIAVDAKAQDKLILSWCRVTTDSNGAVWYTQRAKHI